MRRLHKSDLLKIVWRTFYIQGSWNFERMLNLGFAYCIMPILNRLYSDPEDRKNFLRRHLRYFNAHPYLSSFALGAVARLEEQAVVNKWKDFEPIDKFKRRISSPLGSIGDRLFWGMIKPIAAILGVFLALLWGIAGAIAMFILYNIPHFFIRYYGVFHGYQKGFDIVSELSMRRYKKYFDDLEKLSLFSVGILSGFLLLASEKAGTEIGVLFVLSGGITYFILKQRISFYIALAVSIALMFAASFV